MSRRSSRRSQPQFFATLTAKDLKRTDEAADRVNEILAVRDPHDVTAELINFHLEVEAEKIRRENGGRLPEPDPDTDTNPNIFLSHDLAFEPVKVHRPPGATFMRLVSLLSSKNALYRIVMQSVADMREEQFEALQEGRLRDAKWIAIRGRVSTIMAALLHVGFWALVGKVMKMWRGE